MYENLFLTLVLNIADVKKVVYEGMPVGSLSGRLKPGKLHKEAHRHTVVVCNQVVSTARIACAARCGGSPVRPDRQIQPSSVDFKRGYSSYLAQETCANHRLPVRLLASLVPWCVMWS